MKFNLAHSNGTNKLAIYISQSINGTLNADHMDDSKPLKEHLDSKIPQEWVTTISGIFQQERELINKRRVLMERYKIEFQSIGESAIAKFKVDNPELFI